MVTLTGRDFMISKSAIAATALSPLRVLGGSDRIQVGFIGYELIGRQHVHEFKNHRDVDCAAM